MNRVRLPLAGLLLLVAFWQLPSNVTATSPEGQLLFERNWKSRNPVYGNDGVGPLFNGRSCVACHHQGGIGGGGDARFNAVSIGIESIELATPGLETLAGVTSRDEIAEHVKHLYAGFVRPDGSIMNTSAVPHHGGSQALLRIREQLHSMVSAQRSEEGGPDNASEVQLAIGEPIVVSFRIGDLDTRIHARFFHRNTTPLFGSGLIDKVPYTEMQKHVQLQKRHPEISGRLAILPDGTVGRFGWRGNVNRLVNFVDRACANELGLETKRRAQGIDPTEPSYRNPSIDITDSQVLSMAAFIGGLPAPTRDMPDDETELANVLLGEQVFELVGCSVCHVPNLGPAKGVYSDLLLHDLGPHLYDFDAAEPYVIRQQPSSEYREAPMGSTRSIGVGYYGRATSVDDFSVVSDPRGGGRILSSPRSSTATTDFVSFGRSNELLAAAVFRGSLNATSTRAFTAVRQEVGVRRTLKPSNTSQEWRTAPLWGLRDSAPYMHDGRAGTVLEAIALHDGESAGTRDRFLNLSLNERKALLAFLDTLVAPADAIQPTE